MGSHKTDLELGNLVQESVDSFLKRVDDETGSYTNRSSSSIFMAPRVLRDLSEESFKPRVVSIGPLHRKDKNLEAFEWQKVSCVKKLLNRTVDPKERILKSMRKVYELMEKIKGCYDLTINTYTDPQISEMMVMDACFILEFVYWISGVDESSSGNRLLSRNIVFDLVLLENQIPLFILDEIYHCTISKNPNDLLIEFIDPVLKDLNLFKSDIKSNHISKIDTIPHILSLLRECYKPPANIKPVFSSIEHSTMHSAVHLHKAGVNFIPNNDPRWGMEIEVKLNSLSCCIGFWSKPTLKIPVLIVHDFTEVILRNLIAYEQSHETYNYIISYACTMDMLVNTEEDVSMLVKSQVLDNDLGSNEEAVEMINKICENVTFDDFFYNSQCKTLTNYCNAYWPKNIAKLKRTYFNSPWNIIALGAGIILFVLTTLQTIYTIKSFESSK
ncbi:UPF0481 protein At3g47200-like [Bidens hawaiensis]|uniref:UPF0481 protein At3g47200-like n=1 Tax=Bidens hawaiensis TaxID=980011 RepID=UPI0040491A96